MKKLVSALLTLLLLLSCAGAEDQTVTFHSVFGLSEGATPEEIRSAIESVFSVKPEDEYTYYPKNQFFYGLLVQRIKVNTSDDLGTWRSIDIVLADDCLTADNVLQLYTLLCSDLGSPSVCKITYETSTIKGNEKVEIPLDDVKTLQLKIDQHNLSGLICWDNVSLVFSSYVFDSKNQKSIRFAAAFSTDSLNKEVRYLYGIKLSY